VILVTE